MYKINDFSIATGISKDTLRYYDKIDFFKPSYIDRFTSYRYYQENQIDEINKIKKLKELGLSLEEIKNYLDTQDNNILKNKRKELKEMMKKIDEILETKENIYTIIKCDYKKYVEVNGTRQATTAQALEVRDNNALYFIINKNDNFYTDFCVFSENNWLTLTENYLTDKELVDFVFNELKNYVDSIMIYLPVENVKTIEFLTNNYKGFEVSDFKQGDWLYKQLEIKNLKNIQ